VGSLTLLDRVGERAKVGALLDAAKAGQSAVLVISGAHGVGKTALLDHAVESAGGLRIARVAGVEPELGLAFAGLQQLLSPMLDLADRLPDPQRDALNVAFGLQSGPTPDRFLVSLAALSLLSEAAAERPMLCVVDDTQWLDQASAQALGFVGRRLLSDSIALLFATTDEPGEELAGFPELALRGLAASHARVLLDSMSTGPMDAQVRDRIITEAHGNPLALLELPRSVPLAELGDGLSLPDGRALSGRIEQSFQRRLETLPPETHELLLLAAAEPTGDPALLWRAAGLLGIGTHALAAADEAGLMTIAGRVAFRHPLVRSAVYRAASPEARRPVHGALAAATDPLIDPERRAWHRAQATLGPDECIAAELERLAGRAKARGGYAAAGAFLERSARLTLDQARRTERTIAAADATYTAGSFDVAESLAAAAEACPLDDLQRARLGLLHARIAFKSGRWRGSDVPSLFLTAARDFERVDLRRARETHLEALSAALVAGRLATGIHLREVAGAARALPPAPQPARAPELLLEGLALMVTQGCAAGVPVLRQAVSAFRSADVSDEETLRWWQVPNAAALVWDYQSWDALSARLVTLAREVGALTDVPVGLTMRAYVHLVAGEFSEAEPLAAQAQELSEAMNISMAPYAALALAVFQGREAEASALVRAGTSDAERRGAGQALTMIQWATAVLYNSLGRYDEALVAAQQAGDDVLGHCFVGLSLAEEVEAATRSGQPETAAAALSRFAEHARACGTDWALGVEARSRALVSRGDAAEHLYRQAIRRLGRTPLKLELARALLLYGEWLRRQQRRRDARDQIGAAYEYFDSIGAAAFAERARGELRATGVLARKHAFDAREALSPQETLIARLAGGGVSNRQIAGQLFISPATVAYHLRKVFAKLGVSSRRELAAAVPAQPTPIRPATPRG
jgi:DNA-binding CsgD family transcriptional regulator